MSFYKTLAETCKIQTLWSDPNGRECANIWYAHGMDFTDNTNLGYAAEGALAFWGTITSGSSVYNIPGTGWTLEDIIATDNSGTSEAQYTDTVGHASGGESTPMPPNCALLCSWSIDASYRGGHPRTYIPAPAADATEIAGGAYFSSSALLTYQALCAAGLVAMQAAVAEITHGSIAAARDNAQLVPPRFYAYNTCRVESRVCTQRRRLGKTGG